MCLFLLGYGLVNGDRLVGVGHWVHETKLLNRMPDTDALPDVFDLTTLRQTCLTTLAQTCPRECFKALNGSLLACRCTNDYNRNKQN